MFNLLSFFSFFGLSLSSLSKKKLFKFEKSEKFILCKGIFVLILFVDYDDGENLFFKEFKIEFIICLSKGEWIFINYGV